MERKALVPFARTYRNNGQHAEQRLAYTLTNTVRKADNRKGGADVNIYQVKTFRATLCHGADLSAILVEYAEAERFAFVDDERDIWFDMDKAEFMQFAEQFAEIAADSRKNGGAIKFRLNRQIEKQREWLDRAALTAQLEALEAQERAIYFSNMTWSDWDLLAKVRAEIKAVKEQLV